MRIEDGKEVFEVGDFVMAWWDYAHYAIAGVIEKINTEDKTTMYTIDSSGYPNVAIFDVDRVKTPIAEWTDQDDIVLCWDDDMKYPMATLYANAQEIGYLYIRKLKDLADLKLSPIELTEKYDKKEEKE